MQVGYGWCHVNIFAQEVWMKVAEERKGIPWAQMEFLLISQD